MPATKAAPGQQHASSEAQEHSASLTTAGSLPLAYFEAVPNPVIGVNAKGKITFVNAQVERTFGYTRAELVGQAVEVLLPKRSAARHVKQRTSFNKDPKTRPIGIGQDLAGLRKDGTEFPVEISLSPVEFRGRTQVFATIVDITARKAAENELLQAQKLESIGRLAGGIAHDFNNVLFAIGGYAELLELDLNSESGIEKDSALESTSAIGEAVQRGQQLTSQLLAFSRQQVVQPRVVDLNAAIRAVDPMLRRLIGENIQLDLVLQGGAAHIRADPGQLDQILINLVVNARDAMPDGGSISIASGEAQFDSGDAAPNPDMAAGEYVFLAVTDTGIGMDHATREHVFEPFFTTKERSKGTGLGLATIYGIVRQAGGHIWVYSEPGQGSVFKLYFPRVDGPLSEAVPAPEWTTVEQPGAASILLVEDDPDVRLVTVRLLERAGYSVTAVSDGPSALRELAEHARFDAVVTDVIMPGMSGIELAQKVLDDRPELGIVLVSGYTEETLGLERLREQHVEFVSKPVAGKELLHAVAVAVTTSRSAPQ